MAFVGVVQISQLDLSLKYDYLFTALPLAAIKWIEEDKLRISVIV